ncbi:MAG: Ig-like domain-containing protein, partial [Candidatus Acidiferrales bacterium]
SGTTVPTGTITFSDGGTSLGAPVALNGSGQATLTTSSLTAGSHTITATYSGDSNFTSSSNTLTQVVVAKTNTSTALISSTNPSNSGQSVTFTATVTPASGTAVPTGTVSFLDGANSLGAAVALDGAGKATLMISTLSVGSHTITATYSGDSNFAISWGTVNQSVTGPDFTVSVTQPPMAVTAGQSTTMTVGVAPLNGSTQSVSFRCNGLPTGATCSSTPVTLTGTGSQNATVTVQTTARSVVPVLPRAPWVPAGPAAIAVAGMAALAWIASRTRRPRLRAVLACAVLLVAAAALTSCTSNGSSSGGSTGTPAGTYSISVTGTSGNDSHTTSTVTLTVN